MWRIFQRTRVFKIRDLMFNIWGWAHTARRGQPGRMYESYKSKCKLALEFTQDVTTGIPGMLRVFLTHPLIRKYMSNYLLHGGWLYLICPRCHAIPVVSAISLSKLRWWRSWRCCGAPIHRWPPDRARARFTVLLKIDEHKIFPFTCVDSW